MTTYWCERAWLGRGNLADGVAVDVAGTHIIGVRRSPAPEPDAVRLHGMTVPGYANCHSHAFHRALRGHTQAERGTFWTWRERMYAVASALDPDTYYTLARATFQEMLLTGITTVGEFHYLHHDRSGTPYSDPNAMGRALTAAAADAGVRITLLDTCYLSSGYGEAPEGVQWRFSDGTVDAWRDRVTALAGSLAEDRQDRQDRQDRHARVGAAIHSVRAVPAADLGTVTETADRHGWPLHVHLSEQTAENDACLDRHGCTPTRLLADHGVLSDRLTAVHATHLSQDDIALLGGASAYVDFCPTTERDLADGIGPSRALAAAGATVTLGSDSHAVIDMHEEMRAVEMDHRLATRERGHWSADELLTAATTAGHRSLGWDDAGTIAPGQWADLVTLDTTSPRLAGTGDAAESVVFAATAADVTGVVASGRPVDLDPGAVGDALAAAIDTIDESLEDR